MELLLTRLKEEDVISFFRKVTYAFPKLTDENILYEYARKLSKFAEFVICKNSKDEVVGMIAFYMNTKPVCYLSFVCVLQEYTRKGIMRQMIENIVKEAKIRRFCKLKLEVNKGNNIAIKAYESLNFIFESDSERGQYMILDL